MRGRPAPIINRLPPYRGQRAVHGGQIAEIVALSEGLSQNHAFVNDEERTALAAM